MKKRKAKKKMKRTTKKRAVEFPLTMTGLIAQGTYNCAHLVRVNNQTQVLRIAILPDNHAEITNMIKRGIAIVTMFQSYFELLGPSLVVQPSNPEFLSKKEIPKKIKDALCSDLEESSLEFDKNGIGYSYAFQHLEYLEGGYVRWKSALTDDTINFCIFSLIWFLYTAQSRFGFHHHDLKAENILFRLNKDAGKAKSFYFELGKTDIFKFQTPVLIPVIIDYDFASVELTNNVYDRHRLGTFYTAPPDAIVREILLELDVIHEVRTMTALTSYDWWSLGIVILELVMDFTSLDFMASQCNEYMSGIYKFLELDRDKIPQITPLLYAFARNVFIATAISDRSAFELNEFERQFYPVYIKNANLLEYKWFEKGLNHSSEYNKFVAKFQQLNKELQGLLRALLSWNVFERDHTEYNQQHAYKHLMRPLFEKYKVKSKGFAESTIEIYKAEKETILQNYRQSFKWMTGYKEMELLKACAGCKTDISNLTTRYMCTCCAHIYCGDSDCHQSSHFIHL